MAPITVINMPVLLNSNPAPSIVYGTSVKPGKRPPNVRLALEMGYRGIDTASSRRHHDESEDGRALQNFFLRTGSLLARQDVFVQSKYCTPVNQSGHWPYNVTDDITSQVLKSVVRSASDLGVDIIDVYFLQTVLENAEERLEAWRALERIVALGGIRYLGVSNIGIAALRELFGHASVKPSFVQNWFRSATAFDRDVMRFCRENGVVYQIFGVFDDQNRHLLSCQPVQWLAAEKSMSQHQALLRLLIVGAARNRLRLCILDGTTDRNHMMDNLSSVDVSGGLGEAIIDSFLAIIGWI